MKQDDTQKQILFWMCASAIGVLVASNAYFCKHMLDNFDKITEEVWGLRQQMVVIAYRMDELQHRKKED